MKRLFPATTAAVLLLPCTSAVALPSGSGEDLAAVRHNSALLAMDEISGTDIWAVGYKGPEGGGDRTSYTRHWDGTSWKTVDSPYVFGGYLTSVTAIASDDVWAVGSSGYEQSNLAEHWDGTAWTVFDVPNHAAAFNSLTSVGFVSPHQVLAVGGWYSGGGDESGAVRFLWNGRKWTEAPAVFDGIYRIDALSPTDAWAVGTTPEHMTLAKHWDGTRWRTVETPKILGGASLTRVTALSSTDVWAAGQQAMQPYDSFLEHWDGSQWSVVEDAVDGDFTQITDISGSADDDVWVSGHTYVDGFLEHWDGTAWSEVPSPGGDRTEAELNGVAASSPTDAWSVGDWSKCSGGHYCYTKRIIQHWEGTRWSIYSR